MNTLFDKKESWGKRKNVRDTSHTIRHHRFNCGLVLFICQPQCNKVITLTQNRLANIRWPLADNKQ
ncbi:MAG: hypothetical protein WA098_06585 [Smithella sp.]